MLVCFFFLGLPTLLAMGDFISLLSTSLSCKEHNRKFPHDLQPPVKGLTEGATLNHYTCTIHPL